MDKYVCVCVGMSVSVVCSSIVQEYRQGMCGRGVIMYFYCRDHGDNRCLFIVCVRWLFAGFV